MHSFAQWVSSKYKLGPTNKLERLSHASSKALPAPTKKLTKAAPPPSYQDQLDSAITALLDADPEEISSLAKRLVESDSAYQTEGYPSPRVLIGVQSLELLYRNMLGLGEDEETEDEP